MSLTPGWGHYCKLVFRLTIIASTVYSEHGSVIYEVTGQLRVSASVPWLAAVLALLRQSLELTQDLLDKVGLS